MFSLTTKIHNICLCFVQLVLFFQLINNRVEHTINEASALGCAVHLGYFNILVERYRYGDAGEADNLSQCYLHT